MTVSNHLPLLLPATEMARLLPRPVVRVSTPDSAVCTCCGGAFPGEVTVPDGEGRTCVLCEVDQQAQPVLRRRTVALTLGALVAFLGLSGSVLAHGGWTLWRLVTATPSPEGYAGAGLALLFACAVGIVRAAAIYREAKQLKAQDTWDVPRVVRGLLSALPVAVACVGIGGAMFVLIGAWL